MTSAPPQVAWTPRRLTPARADAASAAKQPRAGLCTAALLRGKSGAALPKKELYGMAALRARLALRSDSAVSEKYMQCF